MTFRVARALAVVLLAAMFSCMVAIAVETDGRFVEFPLPHPASGPTTIAIAPDGNLWFTEGAGNRIGRMRPDGTGLREFDLPHVGSQPRIIAVGADKNVWFTE